MIMKNFQFVLLGLLAMGLAGCEKEQAGDTPSKSNMAAEQLALESAQTWLQLVDAGNYTKSWEEAAALFKAAVSEADWEQKVGAVRTPLGKVVSRKLKSQQYATSLPGSPDGEYVVIQFSTKFENKAEGIETITPMLDKDGKWRVSGYYIK